MNTHTLKMRYRARGSALVTVMIFISIVSVLLAGVTKFSVSHQQLALNDSRYVDAMNLAEAGANSEMRKISMDPATADQYPGAAVPFGNGSYTVYCANADGSTPWNPQEKLYIVSTGTVDNVSRSVKVAVKGYKSEAQYAVYGTGGVSTFNGSAVLINGDVGSNNLLNFTGHPVINGSIRFSGSDAGWSGGDPGGYTVVDEPRAVVWPTVSEVANQAFPAGGLVYLKTHNDNAMANPPILGFSITNSVTLTTGNYYVETLSLSASRKITFDNSNGPVNLWIGPEGGTSVATFRGGSAAVSVSSDLSKAPRIYVATEGGINLAGNEQLDGLVYAVNRTSDGTTYGRIENSGNPTITGQIIANQIKINGDVTVNFVTRMIEPTSIDYYGFDNFWEEGRVNGNGLWTAGGR